MRLKRLAGKIAAATLLGRIPVRVRSGPAAGAKWTLAPFSYYWRYGGYEEDVPAALRCFEHVEGLRFWDIGAHFGIHTVGVAMQVGPTGQVAAFEPDPFAYGRLAHHVSVNQLHQVKTFQLAASNNERNASLYIPDGLGMSVSHLRFNESDDMSGVREIKIETVKLDLLVERGIIYPPDIIKVDTQGHGGEALKGAAKTLAKALPIIAFSNHSAIELSTVREVCEPLGYRPMSFYGQELDWHAIDEALLIPPWSKGPLR